MAAAGISLTDEHLGKSSNRQIGDSAGLDSKYFEKRDDCISIYGLSSNPRQREFPQSTKPSIASAYFSA